MANYKNDPQYEINLENFDDKLDDALFNLQKNNVTANDPRIQGDHVPQDIKDAFNLPKNMSGKDIEFNKVRQNDTKFKK